MRKLIVTVVWAMVLVGMWSAYSLSVPPETTVPMVTSQAPGQFYIERVRIIMDLIDDGEVTTPANYADTKLDYLDLAKANQYARALLIYYKRTTATAWDGDPEADPPIPAMSADDKAKLYCDYLRYLHIHAYKQIAGDEDVDEYRATTYETLEKEARSDLGEDEYEEPEPE